MVLLRVKRQLFVAVALIFLPTVAGAAVTSECLPSLAAARAAHPTDHIAWSRGCYFKGQRGDRSTGKAGKPATITASVLDRPRSRSSITLDTPQAAGAGRGQTEAGIPASPLPASVEIPFIPREPGPGVSRLLTAEFAAPNSFSDRWAALYLPERRN